MSIPRSNRCVAKEWRLCRAIHLQYGKPCRTPGTIQAKYLIDLAISLRPLWRGNVTLPDGAKNDGIRQRPVIAKYEEYLVDGFSPHNGIPTEESRRSVYVEHFELDI